MPELIIKFESDWRIGTGTGVRGGIDERVRRDGNGLPVVPARTLTGLWRDGCERVAAALDGAKTGLWQDWVIVLFGSQPANGLVPHDHAPIAAAVSVRTATLSPGLHAKLSAKQRLADALYAVRPGVKIDQDTHHAIDKHLRMAETTRAGLTMRAPVTLVTDGWTAEQRGTATTLLALGAEQTTALGGGRRHGLGRVRVELSKIDDVVRSVLDASEPPVPAEIPGAPVEPSAPPAVEAGEWVSLRLRVHCLDPILSAEVATDGEVRGLPYVPGGRVLPVVVSQARKAGIDVQPLIRSTDIICEPLVPVVAGLPARPAPRCLVGPKRAADGPLTNLLRGSALLGQKPLRDKWIVPVTDGVVVVGPALDVRLHNTVHDPVQRPTTDIGGLYSYQSIPAGSDLTGLVRLRIDPEQAAGLVTALSGDARLGRSKKDDYGRVRITVEVTTDPTPAHPDAATATVWLRSDTVLLDDTLTPVSTVDGVLTALGEALGFPVELAEDTGGISHSLAVVRLEGWQTRWVRPRPTLVAIAAGSVLVVRRPDGQPIPGTALDAVQRNGLGERRAEGFGLLSVNDPVLESPQLIRVNQPEPDQTPAAAVLTDADHLVLKELRETALRREVEQRAATLPRDTLGAVATATATQRGNLSAVLRTALSTPDPRATVTAFVANLRKAKVRGSRWSHEAERALSELAQPGYAWTALGIAEADQVNELESWALQRLLAHLQAGGATRKDDDHDGA